MTVKNSFVGDLGFTLEQAAERLTTVRDEAIQRIKDEHARALHQLKVGNVTRGEVGRLEMRDADRVVVFDFKTDNWAPSSQDIALGLQGLQGGSEIRTRLSSPLDRETAYRGLLLIFKR